MIADQGHTSVRQRTSSRKDRWAVGKALREQVPFESLGQWDPSSREDDPVELIAEGLEGRHVHLELQLAATGRAEQAAEVLGQAGEHLHAAEQRLPAPPGDRPRRQVGQRTDGPQGPPRAIDHANGRLHLQRHPRHGLAHPPHQIFRIEIIGPGRGSRQYTRQAQGPHPSAQISHAQHPMQPRHRPQSFSHFLRVGVASSSRLPLKK